MRPRHFRMRGTHERAGGCRRVRRVDLHCHTVVSDGTLTPTELVQRARLKGLAAIAVTDHDHLGGLREAWAAGARIGVEVVAGVELSVAHEAGDVHLLGYLVDAEDRALLGRLERLRDVRARRAQLIVAKLQDLGVAIDLEDVAREVASDDQAIGRPHVARALVKRGHASSIQDAFDQWLADGRPAAVPKEKLSAREAIDLVRRAGGVAVLAHAVTLPEDAREPLLRELAKLGLGGVEVDYPKHDAALRAQLRAMADELGLVATGGSDYHGANKPDVELGMVDVDHAVIDELRSRAG